MTKNKFLIAGAQGQLGCAFCELLEKQGKDFYAPDEKNFDITQKDVIQDVFKATKPSVVINCAAYNDVERAEEESDKAHLINAKAVEYLAQLCESFKIPFVHFSSDYVFDGEKRAPYIETDKTNPLNVYGESKLKGEQAALSLSNSLVFRLSWVYGKGKQNFLYKLREWAKQKEVLEIANDEVSVPTSAAMVAEKSLDAIQKGLCGLFHLTNSDYCSRYELAQFFLKEKGLTNTIKPVSIAQFSMKARRPLFSAMANTKITQALGQNIPSWQESLKEFLKGF